MGNSACYSNTDSFNSQIYTSNKENTNIDDFVIKLHTHQQNHSIVNNISRQQMLSDQRRVVFVSLLGLYQTYSLCPAPILYSAILILPIKKEWIYSPDRYQNELNQTVLSTVTVFQNETDWNNFVCLLKWKDSQKLVIWAHDQISYGAGQTLAIEVDFWKHFSDKLIQLYDPVTKANYNPVTSDHRWWQLKYDSAKSKYNTKRSKILKELWFSTKEFKPMQEIIYATNPSLNPIVSYQKPTKPVKTDSCRQGFMSLRAFENDGFVVIDGATLCADISLEGEITAENEGEWVISMDYNEYDMSN